MSIAFIDLKAQRARLKDRIDAAVMRVLDHGGYVMGPEVGEFERALGEFGQAAHVLSCANGTDALALPLMAWGIGPGDAVFCPSFTFAATAEVVPWSGATPVFVDVLPGTYNLDPDHLEQAIAEVKKKGELRPAVVIAVDLFGQPADYPRVAAVARRHGLKLIADSAQAFGATLDGLHPLHWADVATTSFFPAKPLGCYGDGGAVLTNDAGLHAVLASLRNHGAGTDKYDNVRIGMNSRLDTIQAAILIEKLAVFDGEIAARNRIADRYAAGLAGAVATPTVIAGGISTWAQYTVETPDRDGLAAALREQGIPTAMYYPRPIHMQTAYAAYPVGGNGLPVTMAAAGRVISLPMHADLDEATQGRIVAAVRAFVKR
ncbi:MAG TPA: DegT/DnrJ/EryC1/StrS aminotransferase family protein [Caulobacteraceae bacterium]|jgi:dTDP-4-amino-4,6-dideoxygalactose transaminase|nr:DegT/DnrJ/EryC1/StrS aminotransferase family protein [Caulobacteraceae bacterium]